MRYLFIALIVATTACAVSTHEPVYFANPNLKTAVKTELEVIDPNPTKTNLSFV